MTAIWQPGHTYVPGSIVRPTFVLPSALPDVTNGSFETGDFTGWTVSAGSWAVVGGGFTGGFMAKITSNGFGQIVSTQRAPVSAGATINAQVMARFNNSGTDDKSAALFLMWFDGSGTFISTSASGPTLTGKGGSFKPVSVSVVAPPNAAFVAMHLEVNNGTHGGNIDIDAFTWSSSTAGAPAGLVYKATQAAPGKSGANEPAWPSSVGVPVTDNQVTWEGIIATQLVWTANPVNKSGGSEPAWPTQPGAAINDNGIVWIAKSPAIADANCPHSKIVAIAASKVYAGDNDVIRYSATVNPLDWSAKNDAGYLPFGLQMYGSNPVQALNLYRGNLVAFNSEGFQMWQVDEDPANSGLLDALPVASTHHLAASPVSNDLLFLAAEGVRSMGIAAASTNLQGSDVGMPIDVLVKAAVDAADAAGIPMIAAYVPSLGQYWLAAANYPAGPLVISGNMPDAYVGQLVAFQYGSAGGTPPNTFTISAGALPPGLTLSSTGFLSGTPTTPGAYSWTVRGTDSTGYSMDLPDGNVVWTLATYDPTYTVNMSLTNGNRRVAYNGSGGSAHTQINAYKPSGKWYFEVTTIVAPPIPQCGNLVVVSRNVLPPNNPVSSADVNYLVWCSDGTGARLGVNVSGLPTWNAQGSVIGIAIDANTRNVWLRINGTWYGGGDPAAGTSPYVTLPLVSGTMAAGFDMTNYFFQAGTYELNTGQAPFQAPIPAGFSPYTTP